MVVNLRLYFPIDNFFSFLRCYRDAVGRERVGGATQRELAVLEVMFIDLEDFPE